jgi:hypothetical protein
MESTEEGFAEAHGYEYEPFEGNEFTIWGNAFEDAIALHCAARRESAITEREGEYAHHRLPYLTCHIDGRYADGRLHEAKTTSSITWRSKWGEPGTDHVPREYMIQVQHQMMLADAQECIVSVLVFPERVTTWHQQGVTPDGRLAEMWTDVLDEMGCLYQYPVRADRQTQDMMESYFEMWWEKYVVGRTPPPAKSYDDLRAMYPEPIGTVVASEQLERWAREYKDIGAEMSRAKKRRDELKVLILRDMLAGAEAPVEEDSVEKIVLRDMSGRKLASWNGKTFR